MVKIFLIATLGILVLSQQCYKYDCTNTTTSSECMHMEDNTVEQKLCQLDLTCADNVNTGECTVRPQRSRYPGEYCSLNIDCASNKCSSNTCVGLSSGSACTSSISCSVGFYCSSAKTCRPQVNLGDQCVSSEQCSSHSLCESGKCVAYFSLNNGDNTTNTLEPNFFPACSSGYAESNSWGFNCAPAPVSVSQNPIKCAAGSTCQSQGLSVKNCQCGLDGNGYCPLFEGDGPVVQMIQSWKNVMSIPHTCHTSRRFSFECYVTIQGSSSFTVYLQFYRLYQLYFNDVWTKLPGSNQCQRLANIPDFVHTEMQLNKTAPVCPIYYTIDAEYTNGQCVWNNQNVFDSLLATSVTVFYCNNTASCHGKEGKNGTCYEINQNHQKPGQSCKVNENCLSGSCNLTCQGLEYNQSCIHKWSCNPGLYCPKPKKGLTATCQPVSQIGQFCSKKVPCANTLLCDQGICVDYYSKDIGQSTSVYKGYAPACATGFAIPAGHDTFICEFAPQSNQTGTKCALGTSCSDSSGKYKKPCQCGFDGYSYCGAFEGDSYLQKAILNFRKINRVVCNIDLGISAGCFANNLTDLLNFYFYLGNFSMYRDLPFLLNNPNKKVSAAFEGDYYTSQDEIKRIEKELHPNDDSSSSSGSSSSSFGALVTIAVVSYLI